MSFSVIVFHFVYLCHLFVGSRNYVIVIGYLCVFDWSKTNWSSVPGSLYDSISSTNSVHIMKAEVIGIFSSCLLQHLAARKEQSALRAVIKCIEEYKLQEEFPPENLKKRLEQLEKVKVEKRKPAAVPANKRTRANNGGPMPPAKAGRLTNAYVSSYPAAPAFVRSPSHSQYPAGIPPYHSPPSMYGSRSPPANPYTYSPEAAPPLHAGSFPSPPMSYPAYGGYGSAMPPAYQPAYYR